MRNEYQVVLEGHRLGGGYLQVLRSTTEPVLFQVIRSGYDADGAYFFFSVVRSDREATEVYFSEVLGL